MISWLDLEESWCAETSADPDNWTPENPAWGQCAVTALIVQDHLGGLLLRTCNEGVSHYWNRIGGIEIDLTRSQFKGWNPDEVVLRDRDYVLGFPKTQRRYELLSARLVEPF